MELTLGQNVKIKEKTEIKQRLEYEKHTTQLRKEFRKEQGDKRKLQALLNKLLKYAVGQASIIMPLWSIVLAMTTLLNR